MCIASYTIVECIASYTTVESILLIIEKGKVYQPAKVISFPQLAMVSFPNTNTPKNYHSLSRISDKQYKTNSWLQLSVY